MSEIDLLPRADLPVIWDAFKAEAEIMRNLTETIAVTDVSQEKEMALARKTRLTLRGIRIAVEHKRVELGEGHLKEIQKVNGAAKAIREFIEPLEARLLIQESFAERVEEKRISELAIARYLEASAIRPHYQGTNMGRMLQKDFDALIVNLKQEKADIEEANRARIEAEKQLAEVRAEAQKRAIELQLELKAESDRLKAEKVAENAKFAAALELAQRVALDVKQRSDAEAERVRLEQEEKLRSERSAAEAIRTLERVEAEKRRQADLQIEREKTAKLEAELAQERAAKQAEADAVRRLALAPDVVKLRDFAGRIQGITCPLVTSDEAHVVVGQVSRKFDEIVLILKAFCRP